MNTIVERKKYDVGIHNISNSDYHNSEGISRSGIISLRESTLGFYQKYITNSIPKKEPTNQMILGSLIHTMVLEPHKLNEEYYFTNKITGTGSREINNLNKLKAGSRQIVDINTYNKAQNITQAVLSHNKVIQLMSGSMIERSIFWKDKETNILCKARPDIWNEKLNIFTDLKTSSNPNIDTFTYSVRSNGYHMQAAMQIDGASFLGKTIGMASFCFIVVPTQEPYKPYIYELGQEEIELGRTEYRNGLKVLKKCMDTDIWDAEREEIVKINFSNWQLNNTNSFSKLMEIYS